MARGRAWLAGGVALLLAGGGALYAFAPWLAAESLRRQLRTHGVVLDSVAVTELGPSRLRLRDVRATWHGEGASARIALDRLAVEWAPAQLLQGRVERVTVGPARVALSLAERPEEKGPTLPPLALPVLPVGEIALQGLTLTGLPWADEPLHASGRLRSGAEGTRVTTRVGTVEEGRLSAMVHSDGQGLHLALGPPGGEDPWLTLSLGPAVKERRTLALEFDAQSAALRSHLGPWLPPTTGRIDTAAVRLSMRGHVPNAPERWSAEAVLTGTYRLSLAGSGAEGHVEGDLRVAGGVLSAQATGAATLPLPGTGDAPVLQAALLRPLELRTALAPWFAWPAGRARVEGHGTADFSIDGLPHTILAGELNDPVLRFGGGAEAEADLRLTATHRNLGAAQSVQVALVGPAAWRDQHLVWQPQPGPALRLSGLSIGSEAVDLPIRLVAPARVSAGRDGNWHAEQVRLELDAPPLQLANARIDPGRTRLHFTTLSGHAGDWHARGRVEVAASPVRVAGQALPPLVWSGDFRADPAALQVDYRGVGDRLQVHGSARQALPAGDGESHFTLEPITFAPEGVTLGALLPGSDLPFDLGAGRVGAEGRLRWEIGADANVSGRGTLDAEGLGGFVRDFLFTGADARVPWVLRDGVPSTGEPVAVTVASASVGFPLRDIRARVSVHGGEQRRLLVEDLSADLFGGRLTAERILLDPVQPASRFEVNLHDIELARVLQLERQAQFEGSGRISGVLPMVWTPAGLAVDQGALAAAEPGGRLRFRPQQDVGAMAGDNQQLRLALQALQDFRYEVLRAEVDYRRDGALHLFVRLEGSNPELFDGRTIQFNINLEENIPALLRSLRVGEALGEEVERWVREFYRQRR